MTRYVVSDIHFQSRSRGDELGEDGRKVLREFLLSIPDKSLILLGDILDLLRDFLWKIEQDDDELLALLFQKAKVWVAGNHDIEAMDFLDQHYRGVPIVRSYVEGSTIFIHGDVFDRVQEGWVGPTVTQMVDWLADRLGKRVNTWARKMESWARSIGRFGRPEDYREKAFHFLRENTRYRRMVMAHTHQPDYVKRGDLEVCNSGCWINGSSDYLAFKMEEL